MNKHLIKLSQYFLVAAFCASGASHALPAVPVFLKETVPPNLLITLDDSGSMAWGYVPDAISGQSATNRFKAAAYNPMQYDPTVTYRSPPKADGTRYSTTFTSAYLDGFRQVGNVNLSTSYAVTTVYTVGNTTQTTAGTPEPAYYYLYDASIAGCIPANRTTSDACYRKVVVGTAEQQNFANWYSFYRVRHLTMKSGVLIALADLDPQSRIAWQALNNCTGNWGSNNCTDITGALYDNRMRAYSTAHRTNFFNWVANSGGNSGTPLRAAFVRAGDYFSRPTSDATNPWLDVPTANATANVCRLSYHIAFTDGIWNTTPAANVTYGGVLVGNSDNTAAPAMPDGTPYVPAAPYTDGNTGSLADLAFKHWRTDLQPGMPNEVPAFSSNGNTNLPTGTVNGNVPWTAAEYWNPRNDPARWQHLSTYTIGLGLVGTLTDPPWQKGTFETVGGLGYNQFATGARPWPATGDNFSPGNVYDLWHAAINGRGEFFAADTAEKVYEAFQTILGRIAGRTGSSGTAATTSGFVFSSTAVYLSTFSSTNWSGELFSRAVAPDGSISTTDAWNSTNTLLPTMATARNLYSRQLKTTALPAPPVIPFTWAAMNTDTRAAMQNNPDVVSWLRGDPSLEKDNTACSSGCIYRKRLKVLGDILGSAPTLSFREDFGYKDSTWTGAGAPYLAYLATKVTRTPLVLVGANDGFVHGFNANTGTELFGYAPGELVPTLWRLSEPTYVKRAYADGPITVGDAYIGGAWGTYAVGTLGPGGKSVYALNITNPSSFSASSVLWEFTHPDLGNVISKPVITRLPSGDWVAMFSGGYENTTDTAALFTLNLSTGALLSVDKLTPTANACGGSVAGIKNGLGAPRAFTTKEGQFFVYAGDLYGNLWRFEYQTGSDPIRRSFSTTAQEPLFKACNGSNLSQAMTTSPAVVSFGSSPMVFFGTGRLFDTGDSAITTTNSLYAVIDDNSPYTGNRSSVLGMQTISSSTTIGTTPVRVVSANGVNLVSKRGWYIDFPSVGERVLATPTLLDERVAFNTFTPITDSCEANGSTWTFLLDALTGGRLESASFDVNGDGKFSNLDNVGGTATVTGTPPSAVRVPASISGVTALRTLDTPRTGFTRGSGGCGPGQIKLVSSNAYTPGTSQNCTPGPTFRSGWRQLR